MKAWLIAAVYLISTETTSAAAVSVEIAINGLSYSYQCAVLTCLSTGVGDGAVYDPQDESSGQPFAVTNHAATVRFDAPDTAFKSYYYSRSAPELDVESGRRGIDFSGSAIVELIIQGNLFTFSAPTYFYPGEVWPAYAQRIYQSGCPRPLGRSHRNRSHRRPEPDTATERYPSHAPQSNRTTG